MQDNQFLNVLGNQGSELSKEMEDERVREKEESLGFMNVRQAKSPFSQYNSFNYKLTEEEQKAQEEKEDKKQVRNTKFYLQYRRRYLPLSWKSNIETCRN